MGSSGFVRKLAIGLLAGGTVIGLTATAGVASGAPQGRHPLDGSTPKWLHQAHDMGASPSVQQMNFGVLLGMPTSFISAISGIVGVDQGSVLKSAADMEPGPPPGLRTGIQPCSAYYAQKVATSKPPAYGKHQPYDVCGYGPQQLQGAYGES